MNAICVLSFKPCIFFCVHAEIQKRAAKPIRGGQDVLVQSQTGSGKTLAFVMPLLARLQYPPALYPEDLKVRVIQVSGDTPSGALSVIKLKLSRRLAMS